jgi:hypothetical protein
MIGDERSAGGGRSFPFRFPLMRFAGTNRADKADPLSTLKEHSWT